MKTLREKYTELETEIRKTYNTLIGLKDYSLTDSVLGNYKSDEKRYVENLLEEEDFSELCEYDFQEFLPEIYYNNRRGEEKMCRLLKATADSGLYVLNSDNDNAFFISFSDLNGLDSKLSVIEEIEKLVG